MDLFDKSKRERFFNGLSSLSIQTKEENFINEWIFIGGSEGRCLNLANMVKTFILGEQIPNRHTCICGERLSSSYYILNMYSRKVVSICEECSEPFKIIDSDVDVEMDDEDTSDTVILESDEEQQNFICISCGTIDFEISQDNELCGWCKGESIFTYGIHKGKTFMDVYQNEDFYCKWISTHAKKGQTLLFKKWLQMQNCDSSID